MHVITKSLIRERVLKRMQLKSKEKERKSKIVA